MHGGVVRAHVEHHRLGSGFNRGHRLKRLCKEGDRSVTNEAVDGNFEGTKLAPLHSTEVFSNPS